MDYGCPHCRNIIKESFINRIFWDGVIDRRNNNEFDFECPFCEKKVVVNVESVPVFTLFTQEQWDIKII